MSKRTLPGYVAAIAALLIVPSLSSPRGMNWLGVGRYGSRAGEIVLLPRACMNIPIEDRYYFAGRTH